MTEPSTSDHDAHDSAISLSASANSGENGRTLSPEPKMARDIGMAQNSGANSVDSYWRSFSTRHISIDVSQYALWM